MKGLKCGLMWIRRRLWIRSLGESLISSSFKIILSWKCCAKYMKRTCEVVCTAKNAIILKNKRKLI